MKKQNVNYFPALKASMLSGILGFAVMSVVVFIFALMAAGGDSGAAFGPQLVGLITDGVMTIDGVSSFAQNFGVKSIPIKPIGSRVIVELLKDKQGKIGSLYVPESAQQTPNQAVVVAVGPGQKVNGVFNVR